ncbi:TraX family protein [Leptolyngbya sp. CCNP1308]|uniref:TraX family protein n=1 Tax=Leptolyngbya sp. CCNP1308 TaxID=3110255 RepID=UPI002B1FB5A2|nr:TraX family protein [Leptolyngbya sp. CCNP1308]MEA5453037.1 TraX family protein [Leptolyngbya sp. CCNP1308]
MQSRRSALSKGLTSYHIKVLAAVTMLVDHIGVVFFPEAIAFRIIGRLSFPLFVWLLVQGEAHTRDAGRYGLRLAILGVVTQPIYQATFSTTELNILFQLLIGLVCLRFARSFPRLQIPVWLGAAVLTELGNVGYGSYGIGLIVLTRYFRPNLPWALAWVGLHLVEAWWYGPFQLPALVVPLLFWLANGERGAKARWFYAFYPGHLALLWLIWQGLN